MDEPGKLEGDAQGGRKRGPQKQAAGVRDRARLSRRGPGQQRAESSRKIQTRASAAHRKLDAGKVKGPGGPLMADEPGRPIHRRSSRNQARTVAGERVRSTNQ